ncbi:MAG: peptidoglycan editing factor PgeF [Bacilli bacterium]|nr:peptidoglycan editing factor PgeF [Bacilli bacterium]
MFTNDTMLHTNINGVNYLQFKKLLELNIKHCFVLNELNFSFKLQSEEKNLESFKTVTKDFNFNLDNLCRPCQEHTNTVLIVKDKKGRNIPEFNDCDGLITNQKETPLAITTADCIPIIIYDPVNKVIANVHSGWKGTLNTIIINAINKMQDSFDSKFEDLLFFFGPSICTQCFEVQTDVRDLFYNKFSYLPNINQIIKIGKIVNGIQKYNIDTLLLNKTLLNNLNISNKNMYFSNICTCCNSKYMHSYRARKSNIFGLGVTIVSL